MENLARAHKRLAADVETVIADMDEMLKALAVESADKTASVRARYEAALRRARIGIAETKALARARARRAVGDADVFAHQHPWRTAGMAAATGAALGAVIGLLSARH